MIVITTNGRITVLTGWRAWLAGAAIFAATVILFALIAFVLLGIAITVWAVLFLIVPVAIGVAVLASLLPVVQCQVKEGVDLNAAIGSR